MRFFIVPCTTHWLSWVHFYHDVDVDANDDDDGNGAGDEVAVGQ